MPQVVGSSQQQHTETVNSVIIGTTATTVSCNSSPSRPMNRRVPTSADDLIRRGGPGPGASSRLQQPIEHNSGLQHLQQLFSRWQRLTADQPNVNHEGLIRGGSRGGSRGEDDDIVFQCQQGLQAWEIINGTAAGTLSHRQQQGGPSQHTQDSQTAYALLARLAVTRSKKGGSAGGGRRGRSSAGGIEDSIHRSSSDSTALRRARTLAWACTGYANIGAASSTAEADDGQQQQSMMPPSSPPDAAILASSLSHRHRLRRSMSAGNFARWVVIRWVVIRWVGHEIPPPC